MPAAPINEKSIFNIARRIDSREARAEYLEQVCGDNPQRLGRVVELLQIHDQEQSFLESPVVARSAFDEEATMPPLPAERPGALIGPYKLLEQIGEGGMGVVYVAEQTEPVRRRVALKIIKPGMDTRQVIARFEAERQALEMMDHPNIARVLDAGTTEAGRPYFVMEVVRGMPISEYCDKARLDPRQRLALFADVCQAVQHAHQKGVIHRDLKPSNVMVTTSDGRPVVKVIDFGVAKAVGQQLTERTVYTALTQLVGTPLYMSPEQAELTSHDVDTRSDVYSLGVLLYELLTGQTPFDKERLKNVNFDEMRRIIREDEPPKPSHRISTLSAQASSTISQQRSLDERHLGRVLRGELDWIVMKALEKDRSRRYESASALAADIQRYLSDEPVLACPPTTMYRFQKFARKHKATLSTAAAISACLILGTTVSAWQAVRATAAEEQAATNEAQAVASAQKATERAIEATIQRDEAQKQRDEAQKQRDEVRSLNEKLQATQAELRSTLYAAHINLAKNAWDSARLDRADELLNQLRPQPGEADLRGFEWHYFYRLCHSEMITLKGHTSMVPGAHTLAFNPDGKRLAGCAGTGAVVRVWDIETGKDLLTLKEGGASVAFSPDGKLLASGTNGVFDKTTQAYGDGQVKVWDAQTGTLLFTLKGHDAPVKAIAFSPDSTRLASGSGSVFGVDRPGQVKVWDARTGQELLTLVGHTDAVWSVAFNTDGSRLASASSKAVKVWNAQSGSEVLTLKVGGVSVTFSPDGKRLASASQVAVNLWDAQTGEELLNIKEVGQLNSVVFSSDGERLASSIRGGAKVWDAKTGRELLAYKGHTGWVSCVVFSPDDERLASGGADGTVKIWNASSNQEHVTLSGSNSRVSCLGFSPDGKRLVTGSGTDYAVSLGDVKLWDAVTGRELIALKGHGLGVWSVAYSPSGKRVASASDDKTVKIWDTDTGRELLTFHGHSGPLVSVVFSPDGKRLASSSNRTNQGGSIVPPGTVGQPEVKVWDAETGHEHFTLKGHRGLISSLAFSPDGERLATLSRDNTLKVWNAQTGEGILSLNVINSYAGSVAFSPDGKWLASSSSPRRGANMQEPAEVKVWNAQSGEELLTFKGLRNNIRSLAFSPEGKRLAAAAGEVKVWDLSTGSELLSLVSGTSLAFSPDGHRLVTSGGPRGSVNIYDATPLPEKP